MESSQSQVTAAAMTNGGIGQECSLRSRLAGENNGSEEKYSMGDIVTNSVSLNGKLDPISMILSHNNSPGANGDRVGSSSVSHVHVHVLDNNKTKDTINLDGPSSNLRKRIIQEDGGVKIENNLKGINGSAKLSYQDDQDEDEGQDKDKEFGDDEQEGLLQGKKLMGDAGEDCGLNIFNSCHLLRLADMPAHLQFNKFVHTGYRRLHDFWGCFCSLFYLHNETVNIFTHVIPIVWVLTNWQSMYPWDEIRGNLFLNILGWSHVIASISPWLGSVMYHLFMNHEKGVGFYHLLLQLDMFGIWVTECFGALTNLSASTWCLPSNLQTIIIVLYAVGSIWGLQKAMTAWTPLGRRMCFAPVFITRILGFFLRISRYGGGEPNILLHVILQDAVSLIGGMIGVIRIPEKWFPGKLDFFCNSHHIMHVLVVLAVFHMNLATNGDVKWMIKNWDGCPEV